MATNELIGHRTFEMEIRNNMTDKKKTLAFKASRSNQSEEELNPEEMAES